MGSIVNTMRLLKLPEEAKKAMQEHNLMEGPMRPLDFGGSRGCKRDFAEDDRGGLASAEGGKVYCRAKEEKFSDGGEN